MNNNCPICDCVNITTSFIHQRWNVSCLKCADCSHVFAEKAIEEHEDSFRTNQQRTDFYIPHIVSFRPLSIMDIGTPSDFYFLKSIKELLPDTRLYALDLYKKECPPFITFLNDFPNTSIDVITAFHVLEHVPDPRCFIRSILKTAEHFVIEIPNCSKSEAQFRSSKQPHIHFFTRQSLERLLSPLAPDVFITERKGAGLPLRASALMAYRLPKQQALPPDSRSVFSLLKYYLKNSRFSPFKTRGHKTDRAT
jgi:SAM-dependent methyltransferase